MGRFHLQSDDDSYDDGDYNYDNADDDEDENDSIRNDGSRSWETIVSDYPGAASGGVVPVVPYYHHYPNHHHQSTSSAIVSHQEERSNNGYPFGRITPGIHHAQEHQQRPIYYIVPTIGRIPQEDDLEEEEYDCTRQQQMVERTRTRRQEQEGRGCCGCSLWCRAVTIGFVSMLLYYIATKGPPGPPPATETCGVPFLGLTGAEYCPRSAGSSGGDNENESPLETWHDFTTKHNVALAQSLRAYLVDVTWHVLSWVIPQILSDVHATFQELKEELSQSPAQCAFARDPSPPSSSETKEEEQQQDVEQQQQEQLDVYQQLARRFPIATSHSPAVLSFVQKLETVLWYPQTSSPKQKPPLLFWASQMTPGLEISEMAKQLVELIVPNCPLAQIPFVSLEVPNPPSPSKQHILPKHTEEHQAVDWWNQIRRRIQGWKRGGGLVVLEQADRLTPQVLHRLVQILEWGVVDHDGSMEQDDDYVGRITQNVVFVFTSEKVGRQSMVRHLRLQGGNVADVALSSLVLDMRHELSVHMDLPSPASIRKIDILPFWFLTRDDMEQALANALQNIASSLGLDGLVLTDHAMDEFMSDKRIEFVQWNMPGTGGPSDQTKTPRTLSISTHGLSPVLNQIRILEAKLVQQCKIQTIHATNETSHYTLHFKKPTLKLVLIRTEGTCDPLDTVACSDLCAFQF